MKVLARIFTIVLISSVFVSGCSAPPASTPLVVQPTQPAVTSAPLPTKTAFPTRVPSTATPSTPGILAVVPVGMGPITLADTSDSIWVESHRLNIVTRIDPSQNKEIARYKDAQVHCHVVSGGGFVWATRADADTHEGKVTKIDPNTGAVLESFDLETACGLAVNNTDLWVTSPSLGEAVRYNAVTLEQRAVIPVGKDIFEVKIGPEAVWVSGESSGGTVWRIDPATNKVVTSIPLSDPYPVGLEIAFGSVWVGSRSNGVIYRINPATNTLIATIKVNDSIGGIGVGPDAILASGFGDGTIYKINPTTNSVSSSLSTRFTNLGPPLFAFDSIWVGALDQDAVLRLDPTTFDNTASTAP